MLIQILIINLVFYVGQIYQQPLFEDSTKNNYVFDLADLSYDFNINNGFVHLEAFKSEQNNVIIDKKLIERYGQLRWGSIGYPQITINKESDNSSINQIFEMRPEGFSIKVETLTDRHRILFTELINETYDINVKPRQILSLVSTNFDCQLVFFWKGEKILISGKAKQMN